MEEWPQEDIPDEDWLYMRVHRNWIQKGEVQAGFFRDLEMSSDWATYATPEETRSRGRQDADKYAVIKIPAG